MQWRDQLSIPNILSVFRLLLIPAFVVTYLMVGDEAIIWPALILVVSGLTDIADGIIARKFNMVTQLGKILDPLADKLTIAAVCTALTIRHHALIYLLVIYVAKELLMIGGGAVLMHAGVKIQSAKWFGKLATCVLYAAMFIVIVYPGIEEWMLFTLIGVCAVVVLFALAMYIPEFLKMKKSQ